MAGGRLIWRTLSGAVFEVPRVADEPFVDRRIGPVENHPVVGDRRGVFGTEIPELGPVRIGAVDRPDRETRQKLGARERGIAGIKIEIVDLDAAPDELDADADAEIEDRVEPVEGISNDEVAGLHGRILSWQPNREKSCSWKGDGSVIGEESRVRSEVRGSHAVRLPLLTLNS